MPIKNPTEPRQESGKDAFAEISAFAEQYLSIIFSQTLDAVSRSFKNIIDDLHEPQEKFKLTDKLSALEAARQIILDGLHTEFSDMLRGKKAPTVKNPEQGLNLTLVADEELDESILISDVSSKITAQYDLPIRAIRRGIVRLSRKLDFEPDPDAMTPKQLATALQHVLSQLGFALSDKSIIYNCYRDIASRQLEPFYGGILTLFQEYQIIEETENPLSPNYELVYEFRSLGKSAASAPGSAPPPNTGTPDKTPPPIQGLMQRTAGTQPLNPNLPPPLSAHNLSPAVFQDNALTRLLYDYLSNNPSRPGQTKADPNSAAPPIAPEQLVSMLSNLQSEIDAKADITIDANVVKQLIQNRLSANKANQQIPHIENNVIDLINKLFVAIMEDPDLPDPVKVQLGRLQIPYIKVALLDINLLKNEAHPARLLLNEISQLSIGINDPDHLVITKVKEITQSIIQHFATDLNIFAQQLQDIRQFHREHEEKASHAEKKTRSKAEQQAKLIFLKKNVIQQVRKFLRGKALPKALYSLVLKGFAPLFLKIFHAKGDGCEEWQEAVDLFRLIVESAQAKDSTYQLGIIAQRSPEIVARTRALLQHWANTESSSILITDLEHYYQARSSEYKRLKQEREQAEILHTENTADPFDYNSNEAPAAEHEINVLPKPEEIIERLPETAKPGAWCEIYMGRNAKPQRLKISSILKDSGQIVFVDVTGHQAQIKDALEFLDELDCERSKIIKDNNLFDKALASVITNLHYTKNLPQAAHPV